MPSTASVSQLDLADPFFVSTDILSDSYLTAITPQRQAACNPMVLAMTNNAEASISKFITLRARHSFIAPHLLRSRYPV